MEKDDGYIELNELKSHQKKEKIKRFLSKTGSFVKKYGSKAVKMATTAQGSGTSEHKTKGSMFGQGVLGMFSASAPSSMNKSLDVFGGGAPRGLNSPMAGGAFSGTPRGIGGMHNPFGGGSMFGSTGHIKRKVKHRKRRFKAHKRSRENNRGRIIIYR